MILRQRLTAMGWVGLVFFFLGPIAFIQSFFFGTFRHTCCYSDGNSRNHFASSTIYLSSPASPWP